MAENLAPDYKGQIDNKMWITKKCRMNTESRLLSNATFLNISNIYYSIIISIISIISIITNDNTYSIISVILSVALIISITFATSLNYKERAEKMKRNYLDINELETKLKYIDPNSKDEIKTIELEYNKLLDNVENHLEYDYYRVLKNNKDVDFQGQIKTKYYLHGLLVLLFRIAIIILPIVTIVLTFILNNES